MIEITSRQNQIIKDVRKLMSDRAFRTQKKQFVCEGIKSFEQALAVGITPVSVFVDEQQYSRLGKTLDSLTTYLLPAELLEYISGVQACQGIVFVCNIPDIAPDIQKGGKYMILDGISDPGNLGTIMRASAAFGIDRLILTNNCADIYNPKTVRSTMGAIFGHNCCTMTAEQIARTFQGIDICGAALMETALDIRQISLEGCAVVIGSEARGISGQMQELCNKFFIIPINPGMQSLNAAMAAGIIMWEMSR